MNRFHIPRRRFVNGGLAGLASMVAGCRPGVMTPDAGADATWTDATRADGGGPDIIPDVPMDAPATVFRPRDLPPLPPLRSLIGEVGPLQDADENGLRLPEGFSSRILAHAYEEIPGTGFTWPGAPDGGATFRTGDGGWIYTVNSELFTGGGVSSLRFDYEGNLQRAYSLLQGTSKNCSGGATPWHTWLSCEEVLRGQVIECDPWGEQPPAVRPALGVFRHEALAVDTVHGHIYLTEDEPDGALYRFIPEGLTVHGYPDLRFGVLECAVVDDGGAVNWAPVPDPRFLGTTPTRRQVPESFAFNGGEGIFYHEGFVHFATKRDNRIWTYDVASSSISVLYDGPSYETPPIEGVDAVLVSCCGDVLVAEDLGSMHVAAVLPDGRILQLLQIEGHTSSEVTGIAFDPSGTRLYLSSQRGTGFAGVTYEVSGPFHAPA